MKYILVLIAYEFIRSKTMVLFNQKRNRMKTKTIANKLKEILDNMSQEEFDEEWKKITDLNLEGHSMIEQQETLKEASIINYKKLYEGEPLTQDLPIDAFKQGAKWQQERSYSEEEVENMLFNCCESLEEDNRRFFNTDLLVEDILKQFKKK